MPKTTSEGLATRPLIRNSTHSDIDCDRTLMKHRRMVRKFAYQMTLPACLERDDLISCGDEALLQAKALFNPNRGVTFGAYARTRVWGAMKDEIRAQGPLSRQYLEKRKQIEDAERRLTCKMGRQPTHAEVAREMGVSLEQHRCTLMDTQTPTVVSLSTPETEDGCIRFEDVLSHQDRQVVPSEYREDGSALCIETELIKSQGRKRVANEILRDLSPDHAEILKLYTMDEQPYAEIAEWREESESCLRQRHSRALKQAKEGANNNRYTLDLIEDFVDLDEVENWADDAA